MSLRTRGRHRRTNDQLACQVVAMAARILRLEDECDQLRKQLDDAGQETGQLHEQAIDPGDPTESIDYRTLRERFTAGPVVTLHHSPQAISPAHVPSWAIKPGT